MCSRVRVKKETENFFGTGKKDARRRHPSALNIAFLINSIGCDAHKSKHQDPLHWPAFPSAISPPGKVFSLYDAEMENLGLVEGVAGAVMVDIEVRRQV